MKQTALVYPTRRTIPEKMTSLLLSFALLVQMIAPLLATTRPVVAAEPAATPAMPSSLPSYSSLSSRPLAPLTISRHQSASHTADLHGDSNNQLTITYTLYNNHLPTRLPNIAATATSTNTIDLLSSQIITDDLNTLRELTFETVLANGVSYSTSSLVPEQNGPTLTWQLPDLAPQATAVVTLTITAPTSNSDFFDLDNGGTASATLWNKTVQATARPAKLVPDVVAADTTRTTAVTNASDKDLLWTAADFQQDPTAAFNLVRGYDYDPYTGSLRGVRGTLWGEAGNSLDQATLLSAFLRSAGIPTRYRHGALNTTNAQILLDTMFPPTAGLAGYVPATADLADPLNDPSLLTLAQDHWWLEAYLPGQGWTNFDPSFPTANIGDQFATPSASDRLADVPASQQHTVTLSLEIEQYNQFPLGGLFLSRTVPLTATYSTAQLAAKPLSIGQFVNTEVPPGLVFGSVTHTYTPYFALDGDDFVTVGDEFQDLLTTFPLASHYTTAAWLTVETSTPDGQTDQFTRVVKDYLGPDVRLNGGNPTLELPADNRSFVSYEDAFALWFLPNQLRQLQFAEKLRVTNLYDIYDNSRTVQDLPDEATNAAELAAYQQAEIAYLQTRNAQYALGGLVFAELSDPVIREISESLRVKLFYDAPRVIMANSAVIGSAEAGTESDVQISLDLRSTEATAIVYPGQAKEAAATAQWTKALAESRFEGEANFRLTDENPLTTVRIFDEMVAQDIEPILITPAEADLVDLYIDDVDVQALVTNALLLGKTVLIPQQRVVVDGQETIGWWEIDPATGLAVGVLEDGTHGTLIQYKMLAFSISLAIRAKKATGISKSVSHLWKCIVKYVVPALQGDPIGSGNCVDGWRPPGGDASSDLAPSVPAPKDENLTWRYLPAYLCPVDNCGLEQFALPYLFDEPLPLPDMAFVYSDPFEADHRAGQVLPVTNNGSGGDPALALTAVPNTASLVPGESHAFTLSATANFDASVEAWVYVPDGWRIAFSDSGTAVLTVPPGTPPGNYTVQLVAHAPAFPTAVISTDYPVTVRNDNTLDLSWQAEPNLTIPVGIENGDTVSNQTNDGQAEIPDSAFRLDLTNFSDQIRTVNLTVTGAPAGWLVFNSQAQNTASLTLAPNDTTAVGLYVVPPNRPTPGTSFVMTVQASDDGGRNASVTIPWGMPGQAHSQLTAAPTLLYAESNDTAVFNLIHTNVGNASGTFTLTADLPVASWSISDLPSGQTVAVDETTPFTPTLTIVNGDIGRRYPVVMGSAAPGSYTQYERLWVQIVTPQSGAIFRAAEACSVPANPTWNDALESLAMATVDLEATCATGNCALYQRDQVVATAEDVASRAALIAPALDSAIAPLQATIAALATHETASDIEIDMANLATAVTDLSTAVCEIAEHSVTARWTPSVSAALAGETVTPTLEVSNQGTVETSYVLTLTLPTGQTSLNETIPAGETASFDFPLTLDDTAVYLLTADVAATGADVLLPVSTQANASLRIVEQYIQLTAVTAEPAFVDPGGSSSDLSVAVNNVANIARPAIARTLILDENGGTQFAADFPLTVAAGPVTTYPLTSLDTTGWANGLYTITVDLLDDSDTLIPDGQGIGYLAVGEALGASQAVTPQLVAPGTVSVTTIITTALQAETILPPAPDVAPVPIPNPTGRLSHLPPPIEVTVQEPELLTATVTLTDTEAIIITNDEAVAPVTSNTPASIPGFTRYEDDHPAILYNGVPYTDTLPTWNASATGATSEASSGQYVGSSTAGDTAVLTLPSGTIWASVGFFTNNDSGQAELFLNGSSQGVVDLYRRENDVTSITFDTLNPGSTHTISVTVLGTSNPFTNNTLVAFDYIDVWDGTPLATGAFEESSARILRSGAWADSAEPTASGGAFLEEPRTNPGTTVWFPFTGDSVTFQPFNYFRSYEAAVYIDEEFQGYFDLRNDSDVPTITHSFAGLGSGLHMLKIRNYRARNNLDVVHTPAITPPTPPTSTVFTRYEEDEPGILYNGQPYTSTATSWFRTENFVVGRVSSGQVIGSRTAGDALSFTFDGPWVNLGFATSRDGGQAEVFIDGQSQGLIDLYTASADVAHFTYGGLSDTTHTVEIVVLDTQHPNATDSEILFDYYDTWSGDPLPAATYEESAPQIFRSDYVDDWAIISEPVASGGAFMADDFFSNDGTVWFPFTSDSITFQALANRDGGLVDIRLNGVSQGLFNLYSPTPEPRPISFDGLGDGPHIMTIRHHEGEPNIDAFVTPGQAPFWQTPVYTGVVRYEENHPDLVFNDVYGFQQRPPPLGLGHATAGQPASHSRERHGRG
jgi:transglutaminase-like putative cysteine protease